MKRRVYGAPLFLISFVVVGLIMKIVSEAVHEILGHGAFVVAYGGSVQNIYISALWPLELSSIEWTLPGGIAQTQIALIYSGGITVSLVLSLALEVLLQSKKSSQLWIDLPLFWLAFWCMMNATGYLIIGGLHPFGDMQWLAANGYIDPTAAIVVGASFFLFSYSLLSQILKRHLFSHLSVYNAKLGVVLFWFIIPIVATLTILGLGATQYLVLVLVGFIPVTLSWAMEYWFNKKKEI